MYVFPLNMNGKMQGLPVSGPLTVWQLEQGDSVQMSPHRWRLSPWEHDPLHGFHFSKQSSPHIDSLCLCAEVRAGNRGGAVIIAVTIISLNMDTRTIHLGAAPTLSIRLGNT